MAVCKQTLLKSNGCTIAVLLIFVSTSNGINLGLFAGDLKRHLNPILIKKDIRHSPIFINVLNAKPFSTLPPIFPPILPSKLPSLKLSEPLRKLKSQLAPKLPILTAPVLLPPFLPKFPIIPLLPPFLPPVLPPLPIIRIPILPRIPRLPKLGSHFSPLKVPILGRTKLQKALALGSELKPVAVPALIKKDGNIIEKLLELRRKGSLTTAEFIRFKKLLLR